MIASWASKSFFLYLAFFLLVACAKEETSQRSSMRAQDEAAFSLVKQIILGTEYGGDKTVARFSRSPKVSAFGASEEQKALFLSVVNEINLSLMLAGIRLIVVGDNDASADVEFYFAQHQDFSSIAAAHGFPAVAGNAGYYWSFWNEAHEIQKSIAMVAVDIESGSHLRSVVLEEMVQSLGAGNDQAKLKESIFFETYYDSGYQASLSDFDSKLLTFLYRDVTPGSDAVALEDSFARYW